MAKTDVSDMFGNMALPFEESSQCGRQLGVDEEVHGGSARDENRMIALSGSVVEAGLNVGRLEVGEVFEDFGLGHTSGKEIEHVLDPDAHPTNAGTSPALIGVECNAIGHGGNLAGLGSGVKRVWMVPDSWFLVLGSWECWFRCSTQLPGCTPNP